MLLDIDDNSNHQRQIAKHVLTKVMVPMLIVKQQRMKRTAKSSIGLNNDEWGVTGITRITSKRQGKTSK